MLVKSARRYINALDKILKNQHNDIITEITEDDDMDIFSVTLKFNIEGLYCFVTAFNNDDNVLYYVKGNGRTVTYIISDNETQKESMYTILNRIYDIVVRLTTETEEIEETTETEEIEETTEYEETLDNKESTDRDRINYLMETHSFPSISDMYNDKCFCCPADRSGNRCCGEKWCAETWKRYEAIINPEWHHVSLATLANIDFDMIDEKRKTYLLAYRDLKQTISYLRKCKTIDTYDRCYVNYIKKQNDMCTKGKITIAMLNFIRSKLSMQNVESGVWASYCENSTGHHESRRYNKSRV